MSTRTCSVEGCEKKNIARGFCSTHYKRWHRHGDPSINRRTETRPCAVDGCDDTAHSRGWCQRHYSKWYRHGDPEAADRIDPTRGCCVDLCDGRHWVGGYCKKHWTRIDRHGDPSARKRRANGEGTINKDGYRSFRMPDGSQAFEHRIVMENALGRPLLPTENVHHINGERLDNRLENLELWSTAQPSGQRVEDKVAFALEILATYAPHHLTEVTA